MFGVVRPGSRKASAVWGILGRQPLFAVHDLPCSLLGPALRSQVRLPALLQRTASAVGTALLCLKPARGLSVNWVLAVGSDGAGRLAALPPCPCVQTSRRHTDRARSACPGLACGENLSL